MSLALLIPPTCLACKRLMDEERECELCAHCSRAHARLPPQLAGLSCGNARVEALFDYDGPLGEVLGQLKFHGDLALAGSLGKMLAEHPLLCCDHAGHAWDAIVPVPLHATRLWSRGFNQCLLLARWAIWHANRAGKNPPRLEANFMRRVRSTPPQSNLDGASRRTNLHDAFEVPANVRPQVFGRRILVLDDVATTGATMEACFAALSRAGAHVCGGLTLLRALT
jgi:ComF family protein